MNYYERANNNFFSILAIISIVASAIMAYKFFKLFSSYVENENDFNKQYLMFKAKEVLDE